MLPSAHLKTIGDSGSSELQWLPNTGSQPISRLVIETPSLWRRKDLGPEVWSEDGFTAFRSTGTCKEVLEACARIAPCVLIVSETFLDGVEAIDFAKKIDFGRSIRILVLGSHNGKGVIERLLRLGCWGYVSTSDSAETLRKAVFSVAGGEFWADRKTVRRVLGELLFLRAAPKLSRREREILQLITQGWKNRMIADHLCISRETVRWHIRSLYVKIGVADRRGAAAFGKQFFGDGLDIPLPEAARSIDSEDRSTL